MPKIEKKQAVIKEITDKISDAASVVLLNSRGLTVAQDTALRKKLREAGVEYKVYKNTMLELAFKDTPYEALNGHLVGPTTLAVSYKEATAAARIISKELKNLPHLSFKAGLVENVLYDEKGMLAVAEIPPKDELLSRLLGSLKSPIASFARVINKVAEKNNGEVAPAVE